LLKWSTPKKSLPLRDYLKLTPALNHYTTHEPVYSLYILGG